MIQTNTFLLPFQDHQSGLRYAVTRWEGQHNEVLAEFKRMRLSEDPYGDQRLLDTHATIQQIVHQVSVETSENQSKAD